MIIWSSVEVMRLTGRKSEVLLGKNMLEDPDIIFLVRLKICSNLLNISYLFCIEAVGLYR